MATAKEGDNVKVHYTGRLEDGTVFDTSEDREPLGFTVGAGEVIPGFESAVVGMEPGQTKTQEIDSAQAYGDYRDDLRLEVERARLGGEVDLAVGRTLSLRMADGGAIPVVVAELSDETVTLDANHPLAGKDLIFDIELVEID